MRLTDTSDLWWKTAVIYCLDVEIGRASCRERVYARV